MHMGQMICLIQLKEAVFDFGQITQNAHAATSRICRIRSQHSRLISSAGSAMPVFIQRVITATIAERQAALMNCVRSSSDATMDSMACLSH